MSTNYASCYYKVFPVSFADRQVGAVSRRHLQSSLDGNMSESLRQVLRLSTGEGVRTMYDVFVDKKVRQVTYTTQMFILCNVLFVIVAAWAIREQFPLSSDDVAGMDAN